MTQMQRLHDMYTLYWEDLDFLLKEFTSLEAKLRNDQQRFKRNKNDPGLLPGQRTLTRMQYFLANVRGTMERLSRSFELLNGPNEFVLYQLDLLERHIKENILPVKQRLLAQMVVVTLSDPVETAENMSSNGHYPKQTCSKQAHELSNYNKYSITDEYDDELMRLASEMVLIEAERHSMLASSDLTASKLVAAEKLVTEHYLYPKMLEGLGGEDISSGNIAYNDFEAVLATRQDYGNQPGHIKVEDNVELNSGISQIPSEAAKQCQSSGNSTVSHCSRNKRALENRESNNDKKRLKNSLILSREREVRYKCSVCKASYSALLTCNPWWAIVRNICPTCHANQIPRIDSSHPVNNAGYNQQVFNVCADDSESNECHDDSEDGSYTSDELDHADEDSGNTQLEPAQSAKLLVLMGHARDCIVNHANRKHAEVCRSVKFLMLHVRDCNGLAPKLDAQTEQNQPCPHSWCRPVRNLLVHLVQCSSSVECEVCNPLNLPSPLKRLRELNSAFKSQDNESAVPGSADC